jgi:hypothetical protein
MTTVFSYMYTLFYRSKHTRKRWLNEISLCGLFSSPYHLITAFLMISTVTVHVGYKAYRRVIVKTQSQV